ncbi:hypothetical protein [Allorhizocola rhizosphaerae]|uniref:hypothetical protein n=1 Tax=Allorhizocola rhizosphaerae TaxID=1872709 RepID=UPI000E3C008E|nr:hypothetical protein [Allorhizocola rhizosphaerae]
MKAAIVGLSIGLGLFLLLSTSPAHAGVTASVSSNAVNLTATGCSGAAGATFTVTGPDGKSFEVKSPGSNTGGFTTAGFPRGTYRFTGKCANGTSAGSGTFVLAPSGAPMGGDGGRDGNGVAVMVGAAMLGVALAGGFFLIRRRARV